MRIKTSELIDGPLDWVVSSIIENSKPFPIWVDGKPMCLADYSTNWAQGGPIIERERIDLQAKINAGSDYDEWLATIGVGAKQKRRYGPTPLISAMRCFVASKLGEEVDVPGELCEGAA